MRRALLLLLSTTLAPAQTATTTHPDARAAELIRLLDLSLSPKSPDTSASSGVPGKAFR